MTPGLDLTPRERDCLSWAARGLTYTEIAAQMGVSRHRVDHVLAMARAKLGAASTTEAAAIAARKGLLHTRVA